MDETGLLQYPQQLTQGLELGRWSVIIFLRRLNGGVSKITRH